MTKIEGQPTRAARHVNNDGNRLDGQVIDNCSGAISDAVGRAVQPFVDAAALSAAFAEAFAGPVSVNKASGEAITAPGQVFRVSSNDGTLVPYLRTTEGSKPLDPLATKAELTSPAGARRIGTEDGSTVQQAIAAAPNSISLLTSLERFPAGSMIRTADGHVYRVLPPSATSWHLVTASRAKLQVLPNAGMMEAEAFGIQVDDGTVDNADALEAWIAAAQSARCGLKWPQRSGTIYSSRPIHLRGDATYYSMLTGEQVGGGGAQLVLTRKNTASSKFTRLAGRHVQVPPGQGCWSRFGKAWINRTSRVIILAGSSNAQCATAGLDDGIEEMNEECFLVIHGSNYQLPPLRFEDCQIGWAMLKDTSSTSGSHTSFNILNQFKVRNCSIGGVVQSDLGAHYNAIKEHHYTQCQIGIILSSRTEMHNTNRNTCYGSRMSRCYVGWMIFGADTNNFFACHTEGCKTSPTNNRYPAPVGLPDARDSWCWINTGTKQKFTGCVDEGGESVMYSTDAEIELLNCDFRFSSIKDRSLFIVPPRLCLDRNTTWLNGGAFSILSNHNPSVFGDRPPLPFWETSVRVQGEIRQSPDYDRGTTSTVASIRKLIDAGTLPAGGVVTVPIWDSRTHSEERKTNAAAYLEVDILGDGVVDDLVAYTRARVIARRDASGKLVRYYVLGVEGGSATGAAIGNTDELFGVALSDVSGTLTAKIKPPNGHTFERVLVTIVASFARPS